MGLIVVTGGGQQGDRTTEAKAGYDYLRALGIPDEDLRLEVQGVSTYSSIAAAARFLRSEGIDDVILVTDAYHTRRVEMIASEVGLEAQVSPVGDAGFGPMIRETAAVAAGPRSSAFDGSTLSSVGDLVAVDDHFGQGLVGAGVDEAYDTALEVGIVPALLIGQLLHPLTFGGVRVRWARWFLDRGSSTVSVRSIGSGSSPEHAVSTSVQLNTQRIPRLRGIACRATMKRYRSLRFRGDQRCDRTRRQSFDSRAVAQERWSSRRVPVMAACRC